VRWWTTKSRGSNSPLTLGALELWRAFRLEAVATTSLIIVGSVTVAAVAGTAKFFRSQLDSSWLGLFLGGEVRPLHLVLAVTAAAIAGLAAIQLAMLAYLERRQTLAALRGLGWRRSDVLVFITGGGLLTALPASLLSAIVAGAVAAFAGAPMASALVPAALAVGTALACGALAIVGPALLALKSAPAPMLRGE
jgi:hypothetical protein